MYIYYNYYANLNKEIDKIIAECAQIDRQYEYELKYISNGWLKPQGKLKTQLHGGNRMINRLVNNRIREPGK